VQRLKNPVFYKIRKKTGFVGMINHVKKPDFLYHFQNNALEKDLRAVVPRGIIQQIPD
jgi:hypothetical protein